MAFCGLNAQFDVRPECRDDFVNVMKQNAVDTLRKEEGSLQFVLGQDVDHPNRFHVHEEYASRDDLVLHQSADHALVARAFFEKEPSPFTQAPVMEAFEGQHTTPELSIFPEEHHPAFCLNVKLSIKAETRDAFLRVIDNNQRGSQHESLCLQYDYGESISEPNVFHFHEQYSGNDGGKEGFDAHASAPHFAVWEEFANGGGTDGKDPFTAPPVVNFFRSIALGN